jgi:hypothetical protein
LYFTRPDMNIFEAIMLICFGVSWPISILKTVRTRVVAGKSPLFMGIVALGYVSGIIHKYVYSMDWVMGLYIANLLMVIFDFCLYFHYAKKT